MSRSGVSAGIVAEWVAVATISYANSKELIGASSG